MDEFIYVKDLRMFEGISLKDIIIVDNSVYSFGFHLSNGIPIIPFYENQNDKELFFLSEYLIALKECPDVREELS